MATIDELLKPETPVDLRAPLGGPPLPREPEPTIAESFGAAFELDNPVVNVWRKMQEEENPPVPGYRALDDIAGTRYEQEHLDKFVWSRSPKDTERIKASIDREERARETLSASGALGYLAEVAAGTLDPTRLIGAGLVLKGGRAVSTVREAYGASRRARSPLAVGARVGASGAAQIGTQEAVLQAAQETRTAEETAMNIGVATMLVSPMAAEAFQEATGLVQGWMAAYHALGPEAAVALSEGHAEAMREWIVAVARRHRAHMPPGLTLFPIAGQCLDSPRFAEGMIACVQDGGEVKPRHLAAFDAGEGLFAAKVYLGVTTSPVLARFFNLEGKGPVAVFWAAKPEALIGVPVSEIAALAPIVGTLHERIGFEDLGEWEFTPEQLELVELAEKACEPVVLWSGMGSH